MKSNPGKAIFHGSDTFLLMQSKGYKISLFFPKCKKDTDARSLLLMHLERKKKMKTETKCKEEDHLNTVIFLRRNIVQGRAHIPKTNFLFLTENSSWLSTNHSNPFHNYLFATAYRKTRHTMVIASVTSLSSPFFRPVIKKLNL